MLKFKNCEVSVSGVTILADSASVNESNNVRPVVAQRYRGQVSSTPFGGVSHTIDISYTTETNSEPNFYLAKNIRDYVIADFPVQVTVGGLTGSAYLSAYSLDIIPNQPVKAKVQYVIFGDVSGSLSNQSATTANSYNSQNGSGVGHYWTTSAKKIDGSQIGSIIQGNYSFRAEWRPAFIIGRPSPVDVKFISAQEDYSLLSEYEVHTKISGQSFESAFTDIEMIEINNLSSDWSVNDTSSLRLYPASGVIISNSTKFVENQPVLTDIKIAKFY